MNTHKILLSALSAGTLLLTALPTIGSAKTDVCAALRGQDRAHCEQQKPHDDADEAKKHSASGSLIVKNCRAPHRAFMTKRNADHKAWHRTHRGSSTFTTDHAAWHKASHAAHKTLKLSLKAECHGTGSTLGQ